MRLPKEVDLTLARYRDALMRDDSVLASFTRLALESAILAYGRAARDGALREAAELASEELSAYEESANACDAAGNHAGGTGDIHGALACGRVRDRILNRLASRPEPAPEPAGTPDVKPLRICGTCAKFKRGAYRRGECFVDGNDRDLSESCGEWRPGGDDANPSGKEDDRG